MKSLYDALGLPESSPVTPKPSMQDVLLDEIADMSGEEFCKGIINSREYKLSVIERVIAKTLPPAVECRLLDHAFGKPPTKLEHTGTIENIERVVHEIVDPTESEDDETKYKTH